MRGLILCLAIVLGGSPLATGKTATKPAAGKPAATKPAAGKGYADANALLAAFSKSPGLYARFREEKRLAMLDAPLVNEGTIHFAPPNRLARHTERPVESTLLIDGEKLQFGDADGQQSVDLGANPVARLFVDSFVKLLAGDRAGLEKIFKIKFTPGAGGAWQLVLTPQVAPMDKVIKELDLRGEGLIVRDVDVRETSGDVTHTTFTDVDVNHRYDAAEAARVFRLPHR
jgi:hypothetical protein